MKNSIVFSALFILFIGFGCTKDAEIQSKNYPLFRTENVSDIDISGVTFHAKLIDYGQKEIIDYGFIWSDGENDYQYSLKNESPMSDFSVRIYSDLEPSGIYTCRAFIKTNDLIVLGNKVTFTSMGSKSPTITDFNPKQGSDGTVVTLTGKYFSVLSQKNGIFVNGVAAEIISNTQDTIVFKTPSMPFFGDASIAVKSGSYTGNTANKFKIIGPEIESLSKFSGHSGDVLQINGKNFLRNGNIVEVTFGTNEAEILSSSDTQLEVFVPLTIGTNQIFPVTVMNGLKKAISDEGFQVLQSWGSKSPTPFSWHYNYNAFTYNQKGYILELNSKELYAYDPVTNLWGLVPSALFPGDRNDGSLYIVSGTKVYKVGGYNYLSEPLNELWSFNFSDNTWVKKNNIPFNFLGATYFNLNNQCYIVTNTGQLWNCNFENETYRRLNDFPGTFTNDFASSFISANKAYVIVNGHNWQYNEANDTWTEKSSNPFQHQNYSQRAIGFGFNDTGYVLYCGQVLYKYNTVFDKWLPTATYPGCSATNSYKTAFQIGNKMYFAATSSNFVGCAPLMYVYQE